METVILVTIAFIIGWKVNELMMTATFKKILEELRVSDQSLIALIQRKHTELSDDDSEDKPQGPEVELKIEQHQGQLLAFEASMDTFVAQGADADQLLTQIIQHFPAGTRIVVAKEHGGDLITQAAARLRAL